MSHPKRSWFVAWILNYQYELTLTLNKTNWNEKERGREQDSCRTRNQDFVTPAPYHIPLTCGECQSERALALGKSALWSRVLNCGRETEGCRCTDKISKSLSEWSPLKGKSYHLAREVWLFYSTRQFSKDIAFLWRISSILNYELRITKVNFHTETQRNRQISKAVEDKSKKSDENRTIPQQEMNLSWHHTLSRIRICFFCVPNSYLTVIIDRFS